MGWGGDGAGRASGRRCRDRGSRNSYSPTYWHTGELANTLGDDVPNVFSIQLTDNLAELVITHLDAHPV